MSTRRRERWVGWLFALPWVIGFSVFLLYPLLASIYYSLCDYSVLRPPIFIGLENYRQLFLDPVFWKAMANTGIYAALTIPSTLIVSLALALLLNTKVRGMAYYRTIFFVPSLVPAVATACLGLWMFNNEHGLVNQMLGFVGIKGPNWMGDIAWAKPTLAMLAVWGVGNAVVIYLAGLQDVPVQLYEAADLDGAPAWRKTWHITLPMISPVILFNGVMGIIQTLQVFVQPYIMFPEGAPARSTYLYVTYLYDNAFRFHKMGYASAMGWIMFVVIFALTMLAIKGTEKKVHYGSG